MPCHAAAVLRTGLDFASEIRCHQTIDCLPVCCVSGQLAESDPAHTRERGDVRNGLELPAIARGQLCRDFTRCAVEPRL